MSTPWTFPTADFSTDTRRLLPVFQLSPNWKTGVTETLAWLTDVMSSEQAVEQRRSVRRFPRRMFEYEFLREGTNARRIENFLGGVGKRDHLVPLWHEQFGLPDGNNTGIVQFPVGSLEMREYGVNDLVLLTTLDADRFAILTVTVANIALDRITLRAAGAVGSWPKGSRIVPLRRAKVLDDATLENPTDRVSVTRIRFSLQDADSRFAGSWNYCSPLWRIRPDRAQPLTMAFNRSDYLNDFTTGVVTVTDPGDRAQISQTMALKLFGREQVWGFRAFLYNARGRARRFYVPTFMNDIELLDDLDGDQFQAKPNGFSDYYANPQEARQIIGIDFKDGRPSVYRTVIGIAAVDDVVAPFNPVSEEFLLDEPLPPIDKKDVERISFIVPSRFDQDTIEIFHAVSDSAACSAQVVTRSSVVEGMPPIECWVTSMPYPVVSTDALMPGVTVNGGDLSPGIFERDFYTSDVQILGGTLE